MKIISYICSMNELNRTHRRWSMRLLPMLTLIVCLLSCDNSQQTELCRKVDSLNLKAYKTRFLCLDTTAHYSNLAYEMSESYDEGRAEALSNQAFVQYMLMDYDSAKVLYLGSRDLSKSYLMKAVADVGLMKICQVTGENKEFYDYKNDAELRISRVEESSHKLSATQMLQLNYARSEFHLTLATYYKSVLQDEQSRQEFKILASNRQWMVNDTAQLARYCILTNEIERGYELGIKSGLKYVQANTMQKMAERLVHDETMLENYAMFSSLNLAQNALKLFRDYGSDYSRAITYLTIADYYIKSGELEVALDTATKALEFVNIHHKRLYGSDEDFLVPYTSQQDSISTEMQWMKREDISCEWEWIASIRERLSIIYSCMGMKVQSDYNRNIYLDILEATRQDRMLEQRLDTLQQEESVQNMLILSVILLAAVIFLTLFILIRNVRLRSERKYKEAFKVVEASFQKWMETNESIYSSLEEEEKRIDSETYIHEQHIAENKRSYIDKCTSLSLVYSITPFLDRALNEINKLKTANETLSVKKERLEYLTELFDKINAYNDILSHWIKVKQGSIQLNIENFELQPLFNTLAKNANTFANKGISLNIEPSQAVVKADKALTLFMMNTLLDNARKYTESGGQVSLDAAETDEYVEISITDTGRGLSERDIKTICNEKVYDSSSIGDPQNDAGLKQNKGFGFGLMNCKGIIDKYRKTNPIFSVCQFNIDSQLGKGSRFYFRLPKGILKAMMLLIMFIPAFLYAQDDKDMALIDSANYYADRTYYSNVNGMYEEALFNADSALQYLNRYYLAKCPDDDLLLTLDGENMNDVKLWNSGFETDYYAIMDVRNEVAVAALALNYWNMYDYNNAIYSRLYKLTAQDTTIEQYCESMHKANSTRQTFIVLAILLVICGLVVFLIVYYRINILTIFNMRQLMQFNNKLFEEHPSDLIGHVYEGVNDIKYTEGIALSIRSDDDSSPNIQYSKDCAKTDYLEDAIYRTINYDSEQVLLGGKLRTYLLEVNVNEDEEEQKQKIGVMAILFHNSSLTDNEAQIIRLMVQQIATYFYYSDTKVESQKNTLQLKADIRQRAEKEENNIHVQNMVLDNCMSTIKHETMYYPNRIKQILADGVADEEDVNKDKIADLDELTFYYKEIFTLLSSCAARQLENVMFKRKSIPVQSLLDYAKKSFVRLTRKSDSDVKLKIGKTDGMKAVGDEQMLHYLFDALFSVMLEHDEDGEMELDVERADGFVKFMLTDKRQTKTAEELSQLFYPDTLKYDEDEDRLSGSQYMVCRQIIREHDEYGGRRGCRINGIPCADGFRIEFMLNGI